MGMLLAEPCLALKGQIFKASPYYLGELGPLAPNLCGTQALCTPFPQTDANSCARLKFTEFDKLVPKTISQNWVCLVGELRIHLPSV